MSTAQAQILKHSSAYERIDTKAVYRFKNSISVSGGKNKSGESFNNLFRDFSQFVELDTEVALPSFENVGDFTDTQSITENRVVTFAIINSLDDLVKDANESFYESQEIENAILPNTVLKTKELVKTIHLELLDHNQSKSLIPSFEFLSNGSILTVYESFNSKLVIESIEDSPHFNYYGYNGNKEEILASKVVIDQNQKLFKELLVEISNP